MMIRAAQTATPYTVTVVVSDDDTGSNSNSVIHTVTNVAPTVDEPVVDIEPSEEVRVSLPARPSLTLGSMTSTAARLTMVMAMVPSRA